MICVHIIPSLPCWILGFRQDLQKFIIGQEEEAGEVEAFFLQVFIQSLEDETRLNSELYAY